MITIKTTKELEFELEGLSYNEAKKLVSEFGITLRAMLYDGEVFIDTDDFTDPYRINVGVEFGVVTCILGIG